VTLLAVLLHSGVSAGMQSSSAADAVLARLGGWTDAPEYVEMFAPAAQRGSYRAFVSTSPLDVTLAALADEPSLLHPPGAWLPRTLRAGDAFGESGSYNRWDIARLYVSTPVTVARGPRGNAGRTVESWMLFSPYPDRTLSALQPGTLLLVLTVPPL
jgi:hypothetical protein